VASRIAPRLRELWPEVNLALVLAVASGAAVTFCVTDPPACVAFLRGASSPAAQAAAVALVVFIVDEMTLRFGPPTGELQ
jgi:hypothetical protein